MQVTIEKLKETKKNIELLIANGDIDITVGNIFLKKIQSNIDGVIKSDENFFKEFSR